jgi:tetratricopeptide (TPR) repeat protein
MVLHIQNIKHCLHYRAYTTLVCITILFVGYTEISAQDQNKIDSLQYEINRQGESFELLLELALHYVDYDNPQAYRYVKKSYQYGKASGDSLKIVMSGRNMGIILNRLEKGDSALIVFGYILPIARRNKYSEHIARATNSIGVTLLFRARYQEALDYLFESYEERKQTGIPKEISIVLNNIGATFYKMKSYQKALFYFEECLKIRKVIHYNDDLATVQINAGLCKTFLKRYDEALENIWTGIEIAKSEGSRETLISGYYSLGVTYFELKQLKEAKACFEKSYLLARKYESKRFQADNLVYFARLKRISNLHLLAFDNLVSAAKICREHSYNELLITIYEELLRLQNRIPADSLTRYQQRYIVLKDSTYNAELRDNLIMLEARLKKEDHRTVMDNQAQILRLNEALIFKKEVTVWTISVVCAMITVLLAALYRINKFKKDANLSIEKSILLQTAALEESLLRLEGLHENKQVERENFLSGLNRHLRTIDGLSHIMNSSAHTIEIGSAAETLKRLVIVETKQF